MLNNLYAFFYDWLFGGVAPTYLSQQGAEFACILCSLFVLVAVIGLAILPIKAIVTWICGR